MLILPQYLCSQNAFHHGENEPTLHLCLRHVTHLGMMWNLSACVLHLWYSYKVLFCQTLLMFSWIILIRPRAFHAINTIKEFHVSVRSWHCAYVTSVFLSGSVHHSVSCQVSLVFEGKTGGKYCIFRSMANAFTGFIIDMNISWNHLCNEPSIGI